MSGGYVSLQLNVRDALFESLSSAAAWARAATIQNAVDVLAAPALNILRAEYVRYDRIRMMFQADFKQSCPLPAAG